MTVIKEKNENIVSLPALVLYLQQQQLPLSTDWYPWKKEKYNYSKIVGGFPSKATQHWLEKCFIHVHFYKKDYI